MVLYFRVFIYFLKCFFCKPINIQQTSHYSFYCLPTDLDFNFHMNDSRYIALMNLGRMDLTFRSGLGKLMLKHKWAPVAASVHITYFKSYKLFDKCVLKTKLESWDEDWFYLSQDFYLQETLYASAFIKVALLEKGKRVSPQLVISKLNHHESAPILSAHFNSLKEGEKLQIDRMKKLKLRRP